MTLRTPKQLALLILLAVLVVRHGHSTELVFQEQISISRSLAGRVLVAATEESFQGATVELCSSDWKNVRASTTTDARGYFSLEQPRRERLFYVRVSAPGMNMYELRVRINKHATKELKIPLSIAT